VTGEVAEYVAAKALRLKLAPSRTAGYDATRRKNGRTECIQIKGRASKPGKTQKLGKFNTKSHSDVAMMVMLDIESLDPTEIWEAPFAEILERLAVPGSNARARGVLTVGDFKRLGTRVL
jgi:hypothetical protein